jgi:ubiquinone/menaquinone biosynthesis C-methylase UbiE
MLSEDESGGTVAEPKGYVDSEYLQAAARLLHAAKQRSYMFMQVQPGHKVLDVGCGPGTDTVALGQIVGSSGRVCGVDYDAAMVAEADRRARDSGVSAWVEHRRAEASALPWDANEFDACRSERLFQHLLRPEDALAEMVRVAKPGGRVVVLDTDWGSLSTDTEETDIERRLARVHAERCLHNGYSGRKLYRFFKGRDLEDISVEMIPAFVTSYPVARQMVTLDRTENEALSVGVVSEEELKRWRLDLERADAEGLFFGSVSLVLVGGRKI